MHNDVNPAVGALGDVKEVRDGVLVSDISTDGGRMSAAPDDCLHHTVCSLLVAAEAHDDSDSVARQSFYARSADAPGAACDDSYTLVSRWVR